MLNGGGNLSLGVSFGGEDAGLGSLLGKLSSGLDKMREVAIATKMALKATFAEFKAGLQPLQDAFARFDALQSFAAQAGTMQRALKEVALFSGATKEQVDRYRESLLSSAVAMKGFDANQASQAFKESARVMRDGDKAAQLLTASLDLANLAQADTGQSGEALARAVKLFGLEATEGDRITNAFAFGMTRLGVGAKEVIPSLERLTEAAGRSKMKFEDAFLASALAGERLGGFQQGAEAVARTVESMARGSSAQIRAFSRDTTGGILSITGAVDKLLKQNPSMNEAQFRSAATAAVGARAAQGLVAVYQGLQGEMEKSPGKFKNARDALQQLGKEMDSGAVSASKLAADNVSATTVMNKAWEQVRLSIAASLAQALAPVNLFRKQVAIAFLDFVNSIPAPIKNGIAQAVVAFVSMLTVFLVVKGALIALGALLLGLPSIIGGLVVAFAPLLLQFALIIIAVETLRSIWDQNIGGIATTVTDIVEKIKLAWKGLMQAFSSNELSGEVLTELEKAKNSGVMEFVLFMYRAGKRIQEVWTNIKTGFDEAIAGIDFSGIRAAWEKFTSAFSTGGQGIIEMIARMPFHEFAEIGKTVGRVLGQVAEVLVTGLGYALEFVSGLCATLKAGIQGILPMFSFLWDRVKQLWGSLKGLFDLFEVGGGAATGLGEILGGLVNGAIGLLIGALTVVVGAITLVVDVITSLVDWIKTAWSIFQGWGKAIGEIVGMIVSFFMNDLAKAWGEGGIVGVARAMGNLIKNIFYAIWDTIRDTIDKGLAYVARIMEKIPGLRSKFADFIADTKAREFRRETFGETRGALRKAEAENAGAVAAVEAPGQLRAPGTELRTLAQPGVAASESMQNLAMTPMEMANLFTALKTDEKKDTTIKLEVDGRTLAEIIHSHRSDDEAANMSSGADY